MKGKQATDQNKFELRKK